MTAVRQEVWSDMIGLLLRFIQFRNRFRLPSGRVDSVDDSRARKQHRSFTAPTPAANGIGHFADILRGTAGNLDSLQLSALEEGHGPAVWRPEWLRNVVVLDQFLRC